MAHPNGERREYILCAQVDENRWWCHAGSSSQTGNVFDPADMELLDVGAPKGETPPEMPRKRLRGKMKCLQRPRALAREAPEAFATVVALAQWRAEELAAHLAGRSLNERVASSGFEANPMRWPEWARKKDVTL